MTTGVQNIIRGTNFTLSEILVVFTRVNYVKETPTFVLRFQIEKNAIRNVGRV